MSNFAVIFDMDGVIVDSNPYHKTALKQFAQKYGYDLNEEEMKLKIYGRTNKEWIPNLFGEISPEQVKIYAQEKEQLFRDLYKKAIEPFGGVKDFIIELECQQIVKAIGTSAPRENVDFVLEKCGLDFYFQTILDESHVNHGKPNPEIYLKVAAALKFDPNRCIVFEDSLSGVKAAQDAGCKVVGITTTHTAEELAHTDLVIEDFFDLEIEQLEALF
ncbi:MAG: HAD family phosphatase [Microscillaceae bacterium]|nr:HAD family phosphatase [Microscillaceae bacterium]